MSKTKKIPEMVKMTEFVEEFEEAKDLWKIAKQFVKNRNNPVDFKTVMCHRRLPVKALITPLRPFHGKHPPTACETVPPAIPFFFFRFWRKKKEWKGSTDNRIPKYSLVSTLDRHIMTRAATSQLFNGVK